MRKIIWYLKLIVITIFLLGFLFFILLTIQPLPNKFQDIEFKNALLYVDNKYKKNEIRIRFTTANLKTIIEHTNSSDYISFHSPLETDFLSYKNLSHKGQLEKAGKSIEFIYCADTSSKTYQNVKTIKISESECTYDFPLFLSEDYRTSSNDSLIFYTGKYLKSNRQLHFYGYITHFMLSSMYKAGWSKPMVIDSVTPELKELLKL